MIKFPLLKRLCVKGYQLYPGPNGDQVMDLSLDQGPWVILGVNGIGKSTLLLMMRYLLSGAVRLRDAGFAGERAEDLMGVTGRFFAVRVAGDAQDATASLTVQIDSTMLTVVRRLDNLMLTKFEISGAGETTTLKTEAEYNASIVRLMQVSRFEDAVRIFDFITFFFERRQPLIWNLAAQFELFRAILTPENSKELRKLEGVIVSADSLARNLSASLFSIQKKRAAEARKTLGADSTRVKLAAARAAYDEAVASEQKTQTRMEQIDEEVEDALLHVKRSEKKVDDISREYELLKYNALKEAFEGVPCTEQYIFLRLLSERVCLACGQDASDAADAIQARVKSGLCPVCGNARKAAVDSAEPTENLTDKAEEAFATLLEARANLEEDRRQLSGRMAALASERLNASAFAESAQVHAKEVRLLQKQLPPEDRAQMEKEIARLSAIREQVEISRRERTEAENSIAVLLRNLKAATEKIRLALEERFDDLARPFFAERVKLIYAPRESRIGQQGTVFSFPAFEVEMTSGATHGDFVRRTAEQVSLSQRDYLDLIFRMAIIDVLGGGSGTLAVDGPEGAVDAVFAERAGDLFASFTRNAVKNVVLACNIVEGGFIPHTLRDHADDPKARVINLLNQAVPTAALVELRPQYEAKVEEIFKRTRELA